MGFVLLQALIELLQLDITLGYVTLYLCQGFILLTETVLIHLVEVDIRHECITLVTHAILFLIDFGESPLRAARAETADCNAATLAVLFLAIFVKAHL